jgi:hypothetical protein
MSKLYYYYHANIHPMVFFKNKNKMNDAKVLHLSSIYHKATWGRLFNDRNLCDDIKLDVIRNKGYPSLSWLMVQQKQTWVKHSI